MKPILAVSLIVISGFSLFVPSVLFAQKETPANEDMDVVAITENAEQRIANAIPNNVKVFFNTNFAKVEAFRLQQVALASAKRDELAVTVLVEQVESDEAVEENRDAVLEGESTSLYAGAGERFKENVQFQTKAKYYAYKFYTSFVASPTLFYVIGLFLVMYILSSIFRRFRSRSAE